MLLHNLVAPERTNERTNEKNWAPNRNSDRRTNSNNKPKNGVGGNEQAAAWKDGAVVDVKKRVLEDILKI